MTEYAQWFELLAVFLALAYLLLAIRQHIACWAAAIVSAAIYSVLMFQVGLYMEAVLQFFYISMAIYGWWHWSKGSTEATDLSVISWPLAFNIFPVILIVVMSGVSGFLLESYSSASFPYIDSFTTWGAIVATWMVARKILQNWHYWFVIDAISILIYLNRGLQLTALLFGLYLVLIVFGLRAWKRSQVLAWSR